MAPLIAISLGESNLVPNLDAILRAALLAADPE
jgi:hypothetical protein